jgi:hypothetical protein
MEFGNFEIVTKTYNREPGIKRGQGFSGMKHRRFESTKAGEETEIKEEIIFSDKLFAHLKLDQYALLELKTPSDVLLVVLEDRDDVEPAPKFLRQSVNEDGSKPKKGKKFTNVILFNDLVEKKLLDADVLGNQYLQLEEVTASVKNVPAHVKGMYKIVKDDSVDNDEKEESTQEELSVGQPEVAVRSTF